MAIHRTLPHLVCYDIKNNRRLQRIHRFLKNQGITLQYSVFLLYLKASECEALVEQLRLLIDESCDDVRVYTLPAQPDWKTWGKPYWDEGIYWVDGRPFPDHVEMPN